MAKINQHIEIIRSTTAALSSMGQKSCEMIRDVLGQHYEHVGITMVSGIPDLERLVRRPPDLVFLGMKNIPVNSGPGQTANGKIWLPEYLDQNGLDYTGSARAAMMLDHDKSMAKHVVRRVGLRTAPYFVAQQHQYRVGSELPIPFPLFIKPPNGGGGKGIGADSVVRDFPAFQRKVRQIANDFRTDALVETFLPGREFSVAILDSAGSGGLTVMPIELITEQNNVGDRVLGQKIKSDDTEQAVAVREPDIKNAVVALAVNVFHALGARDYGRIDIRLDELGRPHFLEANLIPGLAQHDFTSYFTSACLINQSMDYEAMILNITALGLARNRDRPTNEAKSIAVRHALPGPLKIAFKPM